MKQRSICACVNACLAKCVSTTWGVSSAGRAPALQAGGHRFDPGTLHHKKLTEANKAERFYVFH